MIETSLHLSYQAETWSVKEAVRELISNALDGEVHYAHLGVGQMSLDYDIAGKSISVRNEGVTVPAKALLMGTSESRSDERLIGQFGEGLPMALLVLARSSKVVEIDNGQERWTPVIERSTTFQGEPVLCIKTRRLKVDRNAFEVRVSGVTPEEWADIRSLFLRLDPTYDGSATITKSGRGLTGEERVLLQPQYHGKVYNKGVFVMAREDLMFGYDLQADLNRDRSLMNEYELKKELTQLLSRAASNNKDRFMPLLSMAMLEEGSKLELDDAYSDLFYNDDVVSYLADRFIEKYGDDALAVETDQEEERVRKSGRRPVRSSAVVRRIVSRRTSTIDDIEEKAARSILFTWELSKLTGHERYNFEIAKTLVHAVRPTVDVDIVIVEFAGNTVDFITQMPNGEVKGKVFLNKSLLVDFERLLLCLSRCACRLATDLTTETVLASILGKLLKGDGGMNLAILLLSKEGF
jgi:hypothetical protein